MSWQTTLTTMVRHIIGDMGSAPTYDDTRIQQGIVVSALIVSQDLPLIQTYTFDIDNPSISPDPTLTATLDKEAMALFTLKTACMLNFSSYQAAVGTGIKVRDGDSEVDTTGSFKGYADIVNLGPCLAYNKLMLKISQDRSMLTGKAVTSPASTDYTGFWGVDSTVDFFNYFRI